MNARRLSHHGTNRCSLLLWALALFANLGATTPLGAQAKSMTVTAVTGLRGLAYHEDTGIASIAVEFTVKNTGTQTAWIWAAQDCGAWCGDDGPWSGLWASLDPGQSTTVPVWLTVPDFPSSVYGPVHLTVVGVVGGTYLYPSDYATAMVNLSNATATLSTPPRPTDLATAPNGSTLALPAGSTSFNFVVTNNSNNVSVPASVNLALKCGGFLASPAGASCGKYDAFGNAVYNEQTPFSAAIVSGHPDTIPVTLFGTNGANGYVRLIKSMTDPATNTIVVDTASVFVTIGGQLTPQVTPKGSTVTVAPRYAHVDSFTVRNTGTVTADYALSADCGAFTGSGCTASPTLVTLGSGATARIGVAYTPSATNGATTTVKLVAVGTAAGLLTQRDTGSLVVTALDATAPTITIAPSQGATITTRTFNATVNLCDDGVIGNPVVTFNGVPLADMFLRAPQAGCATAGTSAFTLTAQTGSNTLVVTDGDGYHTASSTRTFSYDDATEVTPQVTPPSPFVRVPYGVTRADTFTVKNPGSVAAQYTMTASCGVLAPCTPNPSTVTVNAGATVKVAIVYATPATGAPATQMRLTVTHVSATNHTIAVSANFVALSIPGAMPQITMSPADGASYSGTTFSATVTWCSPDGVIANHQVWLGGTLLPDTFVPQYAVAGCTTAGTSTWTNLTLVPWDQLLLAQASDVAGHVTRLGHVINYVPSLSAYQPQVTPKNIQTRVTRGVVNSQTFEVFNEGSLAATYQLSATCGAFTVCRVDKAALTIAPGARDSAHVTFLVPAAIGSFSPIKLVARYLSPAGGSVADSGTVIAQTPMALDLYQPQVQAITPFAVVLPGWMPLLDYSIKNVGTETVTYSITTSMPADYWFSSPHFPIQSVTLAPGASYVMDLQPHTAGVVNRTDAVTVRVSYTASDGTTVSAADSSLVTTKDGIAHLKITTVSARSVTLSRGYGGDVDGTFAVQNVGSYPLSVSLSTVCSALLVRCSAPLSTYVDVGQTVTVGVAFRVGLSPDVGTLQLIGNSGGPHNATTSQDSIRVHFDGIKAMSITPDSVWLRVPAGDAGVQILRIHNDGAAPAQYRYVTSCQNVAGQLFLNTQICTDSGRTNWVPPGDSAAVPARYAATSVLAQTGFVRLDAWDVSDDHVNAHGRIFLKTDQVSPLVVSVAQAGASTTIARNQCLTIKVVDEAAYECGDLRIVRALPTTTTLSHARTPTLLYNSRHHSGLILFPTDVSVSSGAAITGLRARIMIDGQAPESTTFVWDSKWQSQTMRIVVPFHAREKGVATGAYHYRLAVDAITGGAPMGSEDSGVVAIVNRATSQFGPGWWLDGYERLFFTSVATQVLWVGGDGSTRLYTQVGASNVWLVKPSMDRPDSLISANGWWYRRLRNGAYVMFDAIGRHIATVDSRQRVTWFNHDDPQNPKWLTSITLPVPIGSAAVRRYTFTHDPGSQFVNWVDAPGTPARRVWFGYGLAPDGSTVLNRSLDQDGVHGPNYVFLAIGRLQSFVDRRGYGTSFTFDDNSGALVASTTDMGATGTNISLGFCSAESASLAACARGPIDTSSVVTRFDGPRLPSDVLDSAWFRVTRYGAPSRITDALMNVTRIERSDTRWPLLATRTIDPVGFTTSATYDSRALLSSSSAISPRSIVGATAADSTATTIYTWHPTRDVVTQVLTPARTLTQYVYDSISGDLLSQHAGTGTARNVKYGYDAATRLVNAVTTSMSLAPTKYHYDALGNVDTTTTPRGLVSSIAHDFIGRDSVVRTPIEDIPTLNWRRQTYEFDVNDRLHVMTDSGKSTALNSAMKLTVINDYDEEGNLTSITRRATPDSLGLGDLFLTAAFDGANRKTSEFDPYRGTLRSWTYDPAGNATRTVRGETASTAVFDALNRVTRRLVPGPASTFTPEAALDDQHFYYDARGALTKATNRYAEVRRVYNQAGSIAYDTSIVFAAALSTPNVDQHVYGLAYSYDLDGRRKSLTPPAGLSVLSPVSYVFDQDTGDLTTLTIQSGGSFRYAYNGAGLLDSLVQADGTVERHYYDDDGRETRRTEYSVARQIMLHDETVGLDARGRRLVVASQGLAGAPTETYTYDGLDGVLSASGRTFESTPRDALGNARLRVNSSEAWSEQYLYEPHSTRLHYVSRQLTESQRFDSLSQSHNLAGDVVRVIDQITGPQVCPDGHDGHADCPLPNRRLIAQSLLLNGYDADGHLLLSVKETTNDESGTWVPASIRDPNWYEVYAPFERGVTEEYRYDPLGRRIWVRAHRDAYCPTQRDRDSTTVCLSTVERTIYDGDQVLAEIRQPARDSALASEIESDGIPGGQNAAQFGQVGYVHGLGVDRPLELWRNYNTTVTKLVTHYQWQGALELGTTLNGQLIQCGLVGAISPCEDIDWPGAKIRFGLVWPHPSLGPPSWWGTMAGMKENATGMRDMRNRQYDPKTGRFTQEDPIGLAGGLNLYGFSSGDAVNFADPFGLCPEQDPLCQIASVVSRRTAPLTSFVEGTVGDITGINTLGEGATNLTSGHALKGVAQIAFAMPIFGEARSGFTSFRAFKRAAGAAGEGMQWHHIVEQAGNAGRFGADAIHNTDNLVAIPSGIHQRISAYYSSKTAFSGSQTVRMWLRSQSLEQQANFGLDVLRSFGVIK